MQWKSLRRWLLVFFDMCLAVVAYGIGILFDAAVRDIAPAADAFGWLQLALFCAILFFIRCVTRIYSRIWRYANVRTYIRLIFSDALTYGVFLVIGFLWDPIRMPVAQGLLLAMITLIATFGTRLVYQLWCEERVNAIGERDDSENVRSHKINVVIVGAGDMGVRLAESLLRNPRAHHYPYCFIDSDKTKVGNEINGCRVYADDDEVIQQIKALPVQAVIIALPNLSPDQKVKIYRKYEATGCKVKLYDDSLMDHPRMRIRDFRIEDLLFRDSISVQSARTAAFYKDKTVMITGGGGSIGSELCRQIARQSPRRLVILDIYENGAYDIQQELRSIYGDALVLQVVIASVRDEKRMDQIFSAVRPNIVIHAAAHKHVPLMEENPTEAVKNNVFGTYHCAELAERYGVEKFLLISTDKAVNPTNVMGASKRLCEMVVQCRTKSRTEFACVRFGNVLGSNGSVIPLFRRQIEEGGPVTLTDKRIVRYFMTIPEAAGLVLETSVMAKNGELYVLDMGKPVKILTLAENMIRMAGYVPYQEIKIEEIGLRPGEKLYEELLIKSETLTKTENDLIFIERDKAYERSAIEAILENLRRAVLSEDPDAVVAAIKAAVPTYRSAEEVNRDAADAAEMLAAAKR